MKPTAATVKPVPPPGSTVKVYYYGNYYTGTVVARGPKLARVAFALKKGVNVQRKAQVYPKGTNLSATNWGMGGLTAWLIRAEPEPEPEPEPKREETPMLFGGWHEERR